MTSAIRVVPRSEIPAVPMGPQDSDVAALYRAGPEWKPLAWSEATLP